MVPAAGVIAPALAGADEDAGIGAARRLAHLDIDIVVVERDLTRHGDPAEVRAESNDPGRKPSVVANRRNRARAAVWKRCLTSGS